jgi:hypothetical protein
VNLDWNDSGGRGAELNGKLLASGAGFLAAGVQLVEMVTRSLSHTYPSFCGGGVKYIMTAVMQTAGLGCWFALLGQSAWVG